MENQIPGQPQTPQAPSPPAQKKGMSWVIKWLFIFAIGASFLGTLVGGLIFWQFARDLPQIITVEDYKPAAVTQVIATGGKEEFTIGEFYKERRYLIAYEQIPDLVVKAFISAEDDQFFEHQGVNLASIIRAGIANFKAGHVVQGGSTITQQVAKSLLLTPERSFSRKIKEVILANRIEKNLTKQQILYLYLNQIYLGHGAYGVESAARTYFRKNAAQVEVAEAALLAGLPQAPGKYSPHLNPKKAKERQLYVLRRMYENGYIDQAQMTQAAAEPIKIFHDEDLNKKYAPYLVEHIRRYLADKYGEKALYEDGLKVTVPTTIELLQSARKSLQEGLRLVDKRSGYRGALQRLKSEAEIEEFLRKKRVELIERKVKYTLFLPDGRMDSVEAMKFAGIQTENELLDEGETYQGVVTRFTEKQKSAIVMIGAVRAELPFDQLKWAKARDLARNDVILVRVTKRSDTQVLVDLEQEPQIQGALVSLESQTGYVLAMEGGYDFAQSEFNRATQALRQPGSSFKPIIYAAGLEKGFTPASILVDSPLIYEDEESGKWKPTNFEEKFYGDTTFRQALIKSRNVPTIKIVQSIQIPFLIDYAKRIGMNSQFNADLSISLGSMSVSLLDLTKVYAVFPRLGKKVTPIFFTAVKDRDGKLLEEHLSSPVGVPSALPPVVVQAEPSPTASGVPPSPSVPSIVFPTYPSESDPDQVMDPRVAYVMTHLMKEVVTYGTGYGAKDLGRITAGKTGTTNDYLDAWFMGFTPNVVTGVWVGFDNQRPIGPNETGAKAALPIWLSYMRQAIQAYPESDFVIPPGIVFASIDAKNGKLAPPNNTSSIKEAFIEGTQPTETSQSAKSNAETQSDFFKEDIE